MKKNNLLLCILTLTNLLNIYQSSYAQSVATGYVFDNHNASINLAPVEEKVSKIDALNTGRTHSSKTTYDAQNKINLDHSYEYVLSKRILPDSLIYKEQSTLLDIEERAIDDEQITPQGWKWVCFEIKSDSGGSIVGKIRRPIWWLEKQKIYNPGGWFFANFSDINIVGWAYVTNILNSEIDTRVQTFPENGDNIYRPITGWFKKENSNLNEYVFSSGDTIRSTGSHPFYSKNLNKFVPIEKVSIGDKVETQNGIESVLLAKTSNVSVNSNVYNIEVWRDHNYYVGENGLLVHNGCKVSEFARLHGTRKKEMIEAGWNEVYPKHFGERSWFERLMAYYRYKGSGWYDLSKIASNFPGGDFLKGVTQNGSHFHANTIVSMKTTTLKTIDAIKSAQNIKDNINLLKASKQNGITRNGSTVTYDNIRLDIYMRDTDLPEGQVLDSWITQLKNAYPGVDFQITSLENYITF